MTTAAVTPAGDVPKGRARRPGPSGVSKIAMAALVGALLAVLGWGIHLLVAKPALDTADPQSWLPKQQLDQPVDRVIVGTVAHPALTVQGDDVEVRAPSFSALAVVHGPVVPGEGLTVVQRYTTCTWTISLSHVRGTLPIALTDWDSIDHSQTIYKPFLVPGQKPLPPLLTSGQRLTFKIRAVMPTGEGLMRWAPDGNDIVAKWDYQVEND